MQRITDILTHYCSGDLVNGHLLKHWCRYVQPPFYAILNAELPTHFDSVNIVFPISSSEQTFYKVHNCRTGLKRSAVQTLKEMLSRGEMCME